VRPKEYLPVSDEKSAEKSASDPALNGPAGEPDAAVAGAEAGADEGAALRPDMLLKRVAGIGGEETEADRIARDEEAKLAERKQEAKKAKKGLQAAASKQLERIGEKKRKEADLDIDDIKRTSSARDADGDVLLDRAGQFSAFLKNHGKVVAAVVALGLLGGAGYVGSQTLKNKKEGEASYLLSEGILSERGRIGERADGDEFKDPHPVFKTKEERFSAALQKYKEVQSKFPGTGAATFARLAEGSVALDKREPDAATAAFNEVRGSDLGKADSVVRARAVEGLGFAQELRVEKDPASKDKSLDAALDLYRTLEGIAGFKDVGQYHQARVLEAKGDKAKAVELLKGIFEKLKKPGEPYVYLKGMVTERLRLLDPAAVPPEPKHGAGGGLSPELLKQLSGGGEIPPELLEKLKAQMGGKGGGGGKEKE
jgi:hypothetical protein